MTIAINRALNLVLKLEAEGQSALHVHSTPISREVFERYFAVMARTFARLWNEGLGTTAGPRVALLMLKEVSGDQWEDVRKGLVNEIVRLSNVCSLGEQGWELNPLQTAFERGALTEEDRLDVESELVFFTLVARMNKRSQIEGMMGLVGALWGSRTTSLNASEYLNSLRTSTDKGSSGEKADT